MMILSKVRLINWYAFSNTTVPIGKFTLIAGKNGNGKSVFLDAIKYALYGDTVFNKSTENKGSRTIASYTRGLLDATAGSYMRPADKVPNVYTHIVMEMQDIDIDKYVILGTVIETNSANGFTTQRYVIEDKRLDDINHTYLEDGVEFIYSASALQKRYGIKMMQANDGLSRFMQRTGLRLNETQLSSFRRKLRSVMSYDPDSKIDAFIRESVLEEKKIDFTKLVDTKNKIDDLTNNFNKIDTEIKELVGILSRFDEVKKAEDIIFADDVKVAYSSLLDQQEKCVFAEREMSIAKRKEEEAKKEIEQLRAVKEETDKEYRKANRNLEELDCVKAIEDTRNSLREIETKKEYYEKEKDRLSELENRVCELISLLDKERIIVSDRQILLALVGTDYSNAEKSIAVDGLIIKLKEYRDSIQSAITRLCDAIDENNTEQIRCQQIIDDCNSKKTTFSEIPDYVQLKERINKEYKKRGIVSEAHFACEYVIGLKDEAWRDAIEGYLGRRRYTILVDPEYYDIADEIFNTFKKTDAHLFNTKLLMKKKINIVEDSAANLIIVKNEVAKRYFEYQLGRITATTIDCVKEYEDALSVEGRVSIAMDSYYIRPERITHYYLGQETIELNRLKAERRLHSLKESEAELRDKKLKETEKKSHIDDQIELFGEYVYDANKQYDDVLILWDKKNEELQRLIEAQNDNKEYWNLKGIVLNYESELKNLDKRQEEARDNRATAKTQYELNKNKYDDATKQKRHDEQILQTLELSNGAIYKNAIDDYNRFVASGKTGLGGPRKDRGRIERAVREAIENLVKDQSAYNSKRSVESQLPMSSGDRWKENVGYYQKRKEKIWLDDLQDIREKLKVQTQRYASIFKNEFVLTVLKSCEDARRELRRMNAELAKLDFKSVYEFDVNFVKDGSDYEKILEYAKYLKEREDLGVAEGQMTLAGLTSYSADKGEELEKEIKQIINRIVSSNDKEQIERFADYRNYMNYEILVSNDEVLNKAKLSRQSGYNSGAEVQIPYMLILLSALLMIYNDKLNSTRLVFIDEPFAKMDPINVKVMMGFMKDQNLQMLFCAPDKTELIGN